MSDDEKPKVFQLGTVPPPPGENDAYNAPTKVGPMAAQIQELINAATEEAERKAATVAVTTAPPPLPATTTAPPPSVIPTDGRLPSLHPDEEEADDTEDGETRIAEGAYAMLADFQSNTPPSVKPADRASVPPLRSATPPPPMPSAPPVRASAPPVRASAPPVRASAPPVRASAPPIRASAPPAEEPLRSAPPPAAIEAATASLPIGPAPIVISEPLPVFDDPKSEDSLESSYSDPIAHTRPEWSSVSKSEPKLPVAAPVANRTPLLIGLLVVIFAIAGVAFLIYGHR